MNFLNPELLSITQSKQMGIWSPGGLPSFGVTPYIKRLKKPKIRILDVGVRRGENTYHLFETDRFDKIEKICGVEYAEDDYGQLINENLKEWKDRFFLRFDWKNNYFQQFSDTKFDVVCINTDTDEKELDKVMNLYYDAVESGGIFCGNNHSAVKTKEALGRLRRTKKIGIPVNVSFDNFFWYVR